MEKEFIPYTLALELKELGFDEPCFNTYNLDKKVSRNPSHNMEDLPIEGQPYYWQNSKIHVSCITAPTFSQTFKFFREKYELPSWIYTSNNKEYWYSVLKDGRMLVRDYKPFETYEEAESACLNKLIEIVKQ